MVFEKMIAFSLLVVCLIHFSFQSMVKIDAPVFALTTFVAAISCYVFYFRLRHLKNMRTVLFSALYVLTLLYFGQLTMTLLIGNFFKGQLVDYLAFISAVVLLIPVHLLLVNLLQIQPKHLLIAEQEHDTENPTATETKIEDAQNLLIMMSNVLLLLLYLWSSLLGGTVVNSLYAFCFIVVLYASNLKYQTWEIQRLQRYLDSQVKNMATYNEQVDESYETVRAFRHDFTNILIAMRESIAMRDIDLIQATYGHILEGSNEVLKQNRSEVIKLSRIKVPEVKSVVMAKILAAEKRGVTIELELTDDISDLRLKPLDIVRLLGIVLDNAIESALETANPQVTIALFNSGESTYFIVENNMVLANLPTSLIFKQGYSTKAGDSRGTGLATLHELLANNPNANFSVRAKDYKFRIELEMR